MKPFGLLEEGFQTAAFALLSCWGWFAPFDAPKVLTCDHGVHSRGRPITRSTTSAWGAVALHWIGPRISWAEVSGNVAFSKPC